MNDGGAMVWNNACIHAEKTINTCDSSSSLHLILYAKARRLELRCIEWWSV
jgi:hypothetical protein